MVGPRIGAAGIVESAPRLLAYRRAFVALNHGTTGHN